jgi:predicted nucleic acid-binding protein
VTYLIDTNVISELRKGARRDANVAAWFAGVDDADLYLSVLVLGEIRKGADMLRSRDPSKAQNIDRWLSDVERAFAERILPVDGPVAREWGHMSALRTVSVVDCLLAATAKVNGLVLVTRNAQDVAGLGAGVLNPFESGSRAL